MMSREAVDVDNDRRKVLPRLQKRRQRARQRARQHPRGEISLYAQTTFACVMCYCIRDDVRGRSRQRRSKVLVRLRKRRQIAQQDLAIHREQARRHQQNSRDWETSHRRLERTPCIYFSTFSNSTMYSDFSNESVCLFTGLPDLRYYSQALGLESKSTSQFTVGLDTSTKLKRNSDRTQAAVYNHR